VFVVAVILLGGLQRLIARFFPSRPETEKAE
jgi:hypothetical protein